MCQFFSALYSKQGHLFYDLDTDSHSDLVRLFKLKDDEFSYLRRNWVKLEFVPNLGKDVTQQKNWNLVLDEEGAPDWFDRDKARAACWAVISKIIITSEVDFLVSGVWILAKEGTINQLSGNAFVRFMCNTSQIGEMWGTSRVGEMRDTTQVGQMYGNNLIGTMYNTSQVKTMYSYSRVRKMHDTSRVWAMYDHSQVSTMHDTSRVGYMYNTSRVGEMRDTRRVDTLENASQIDKMRDTSRVGKMHSASQIGEMRDISQIDEMHGQTWIRDKSSSLFVSDESIILNDYRQK
jgi:hypothetical protein